MIDVNKYECFGYDEKNPDGSVRCHCVKAISILLISVAVTECISKQSELLKRN